MKMPAVLVVHSRRPTDMTLSCTSQRWPASPKVRS
jgi:hypothetical protein